MVLGKYDPTKCEYHREVLDAASDEVLFPGAIYDTAIVEALRFHARLYIHGHTVGGTNPSLVEALGAGCAVLAHDNRFNRWVVDDAASYFMDEASCLGELDSLLLAENPELPRMRRAALHRHQGIFKWEQILEQYELLLAESSTNVAQSRPEARALKARSNDEPVA